MSHNHDRNILRARILLVDDDRRLLQALRTRLKAIGCHCIACSNASEAIAYFAVGTIDLVITDLTMPEIDGLGFIGLIRSQSRIPVIVITGHSDDYGTSLSGYRGVSLIRKPFELEMLIERVRSLVPQECDQVRS